MYRSARGVGGQMYPMRGERLNVYVYKGRSEHEHCLFNASLLLKQFSLYTH